MSNCRLLIVGIERTQVVLNQRSRNQQSSILDGEAPPRIVTQHSRLKPHRGEGSTIRPGGAPVTYRQILPPA